MKSLSEIDTTSKRASRAIGFSWGEAEEVGKSVRLLELFGFSGIKNLNQYYQNKRKENFEKLKLIKANNESGKFNYCPIILGVSFIDQINLAEEQKEIIIENMGFPILFLPFLSRASEIIGKRIFMNIDDKDFLLNFNQSIYSNYLSGAIIEKANIIKIKFLENINSFDEKDWQEIYKLSENTFVEETEELKKSAAGAGLTDND